MIASILATEAVRAALGRAHAYAWAMCFQWHFANRQIDRARA